MIRNTTKTEVHRTAGDMQMKQTKQAESLLGVPHDDVEVVGHEEQPVRVDHQPARRETQQVSSRVNSSWIVGSTKRGIITIHALIEVRDVGRTLTAYSYLWQPGSRR